MLAIEYHTTYKIHKKMENYLRVVPIQNSSGFGLCILGFHEKVPALQRYLYSPVGFLGPLGSVSKSLSPGSGWVPVASTYGYSQ